MKEAGSLFTLANVSSMNAFESIELGKHAKELGASAIALLPPSFYAMAESDLIEFFVRVAKAVESAITWTGDQSPQILFDSKQAIAATRVDLLGIVYQLEEPNGPKLRLIKLASRDSARPGEEVEFTLRFDNIGNRVIGNVTIADNLTTRLEYLPDTAHSSLEADFSATPNNAGAQILRWEIRDPLEAGKGGILKFRCKVR